MKHGFTITREAHFSAAHHLRDYHGPCEQLHGHNWRIQVTIARQQLNDLGMVMDFGELGTILNSVLSTLDHSLLNDHAPFKAIEKATAGSGSSNPTSENIARYIFDEVSARLTEHAVSVHSVDVWETERSRATYGRW